MMVALTRKGAIEVIRDGWILGLFRRNCEQDLPVAEMVVIFHRRQGDSKTSGLKN